MQALQDYQQRFTDLVSNDLPERKPIETLAEFDPTCMKEGYLQKKGQRLKGWKRRWFVCDARTLSYYIGRKDRKPNAVIPLEGCSVQDGGLSETWNSPRIYLTDGTSGVMYCLSSEDGEAVTQWLAVLRHAVAKVNGTSDAGSNANEEAAQNANKSRNGHANGSVTRSNAAKGASDEDNTKSAAARTTQLKSSSSTTSETTTSEPKKRMVRLTSGTGQSLLSAPAQGGAAPGSRGANTQTHNQQHHHHQGHHGRGKVQHLPTNIALENDLSNGLDVLESLLCSNNKSSSGRRSAVAFRPLGAMNGVLRSIGKDAMSGKEYARASVVLPVSSEVAAYLLADHAKRAEWDLHFPHSSHIASFDDATDLVHLSSGASNTSGKFSQLQTTKPFLPPQMAAAACSAGALLLSGASWDAMLTNIVYAGVVGGVVNSMDYSALCAPRDLLLLRHVRETSVLDSQSNNASCSDLLNTEGEECGQSMVLILEKSVTNELKLPTSGVVRAHVGLSGWLLEPVDVSRTLATYVTDVDMKGWVSPATKRQFLLDRLDCVAVLLEYVTQRQLCGATRGLGFDGDESDDDDDHHHGMSSSKDLGRNDSEYDDHDGSSSAASAVFNSAGGSAEFHPRAYMRSMVRTPTGGLKLIDKEVAKKQGGVLKDVIKSAGAKILEGKSAVSLSLPVRIFEPRTNLERITDMFLYAPTFLNMAAEQTDPAERLKYVVAFVIAGLHHAVGQLKPFNPILGETYQATMNDGTEVCCEHTSHHPPISNFQLVSKKFSLAGHVLWHGAISMKSNALIQINKGPIRVSFDDGTVISYTLPHVQLGGFMWGDRTFDITSTIVFEDPKHHLACEVKFNPDEKKGMGGMFSSSKTPSDCFRGALTSKGSEICEVSGSWLDELKFGDVNYWTMNKEPSGYLVAFPESKLLMSDSRRREDLRALAANDLDDAQDWKVKLEVLQRADRKVRNDGRRPNHWTLKDGHDKASH
ncbi:Oxysterol binding family protein, partial [Globisporangium splendens]